MVGAPTNARPRLEHASCPRQSIYEALLEGADTERQREGMEEGLIGGCFRKNVSHPGRARQGIQGQGRVHFPSIHCPRHQSFVTTAPAQTLSFTQQGVRGSRSVLQLAPAQVEVGGEFLGWSMRTSAGMHLVIFAAMRRCLTACGRVMTWAYSPLWHVALAALAISPPRSNSKSSISPPAICL